MIIELLKNNNIKVTNQRIEVLEIINKLELQATKKNIISNTKLSNPSTVYRILDTLTKNNILDTELNYNNEIYYYLKNKHTHYLTCIKCHNKIELDTCPIEEYEKNIAKTGYQILNHKIEILGLCSSCRKK